MWGYYDGYTAAQIELMIADSPIVVYDREKKKNGEFNKQNAYAVRSAQAKYLQKEKTSKSALEMGFGGVKQSTISEE